MWGWASFDRLLQDVRYGLRQLRRNPGFTVTAVLTLALGIGANAAVFSAVKAVLLRPLPFDDSERVVRIFWTRPGSNGWVRTAPSPLYFSQIRARSQLLERVTAQRFQNLTLTGDGEPERIIGIGVADQWMETLGVHTVLGRGFDASEQREGNSSRALLISYSLWQGRYGGQPSVLGRTLTLNERNYTVIGVLPPAFNYPYETDVWLPMTLDPAANAPADLNVPARMKPGVTVQQVQAEMDSIAAQLEREFADNRGRGLIVRAFREEFIGDHHKSLAALLVAVGIVLLIACANVTNLVLARAVARRREQAIRTALGASRGRQLRLWLTESLLLAGLGGFAGVLLAWWVSGSMTALIPARLAEVLNETPVDADVLLATAACSVFTGVLVGILPALLASQVSPVESMGGGCRASGGARRNRLLGGLVVTEIALSMVLLVGAATLGQDFARLLGAGTGYPLENLVAINVGLPQPRYADPAERVRTVGQVLEEVGQVPGVQAAGLTTLLPVPHTNANNGTLLAVAGLPLPAEELPVVNLRFVTPSLFEAMRIPLVAGRGVSAQDREGTAPVAIVSRALAQRFWPNQNPLGQLVKPARAEDDSEAWRTVVGVVGDIAEPSQEMAYTLYIPYAQGTASQPRGTWLTTRVVLVVRMTNPSAATVAAIRQAIWRADSTLPLFDGKAVAELLGDALAEQQLGTTLFVVFGGFGLLMATVGVYGVIAYAVRQRTQEFGIRLAVGASRADVLRLVMRQGLALVAVGLVLGLAGSLAAARLLRGFITQVDPQAPTTLLAVAVLLAFVTLLACWLPARRAARTDPMVALRLE
jgi:putative ABC transport system permease protein